MDNSLHLIPEQNYSVIKPFVDYDGIVHEVGETWTYKGTNFLPYEDGLTLHVLRDNKAVVYRLQWRKEAQAEIIENFDQYVKPASMTDNGPPEINTSAFNEFDQQILDTAQQKGKIHAIKFCKDTKGWGLAESKDYVDNLTLQHNIKGKEGCFVATACYGNYDAPEVLVLRDFRDKTLMQTFYGRLFVKLYYFISPTFANLISRSDKIKAFIRTYFLKYIVAKLQQGRKEM